MLRIESLSFAYGTSAFSVLQKVSFSMRKGEVLGLAGKSGSGKSTLLRLIRGELDPLSGEVIYKGEKVRGPSLELIPGHPKMRMIAQQFKLMPDHTVRENVLHQLLAFRSDFKKEKTDQLLDLTGLTAHQHRKPHELSGGQQQLLAICRALAEEPELLLLDEPFAHLDANTKNEIHAYLLNLLKILDFSMIVVSHDAHDLLEISDRILVMKDGELIQSGSPESVFFHPETAYTAGLFGTYNEMVLDKKRIFIRPGQIKLVSSSKAKFTGKLKEIRFFGEYYELLVADGRKKMKVHVLQNKFEKGDELHLSW